MKKRRGRVAAMAWLIHLGCVACGAPVEQRAPDGPLVQRVNVGVAHLENRDSAAAIDTFEAALEEDPESPEVLRNLARARLLARDPEGALRDLRRAAELEPGSLATRYLAGLALARMGDFSEAARRFEEVAARDPVTAAVRYQLASAYHAAGRHAEARARFDETLRLDPRHTTAVYRLAQYAAAEGDAEAHRRLSARFEELRELLGDRGRTPEELEACSYTLPERVAHPPPGHAGPPAALDVRFSPLPAREKSDRASSFSAIEVLDLSPEGAYRFVAVDSDGELVLLSWDGAGLERRSPSWSGSRPPALAPGIDQLIAGNFHDRVPPGARYDPEIHALNDLLIFGPGGVVLLQRTGPDSFEDVTAAAGLGTASGTCARWLDADHDGDLDLALCGSSTLELWQNRGDGRFEQQEAFDGLGGAGRVSDVSAADLDGDVALDLVVARENRPAAILMGAREGRFEIARRPREPWPSGRRVLVDELDGDGLPDVLLFGPAGTAVVTGAGERREILSPGEWNPTIGTLLDYDNDGWLDVLLGGSDGCDGCLRLWRNLGPRQGWREVTAETGLAELDATGPILDLAAADLDADGDTDLLLAGSGGVRVLRNDGGNGYRQLKMRLVGTKTNPGGYGTQVEVVAGDFRAFRVVGGAAVEIGLADRDRLDALRTVWTNGVVDNQIDRAVPDGPLTVIEKNVATGSCPFLYAWDGRGYRFVTDLLGNSPLGLPLRRGVSLPADPDELVRLDVIAPGEGGELLLKVTSEFREVLYLDQVRLVAVDHPVSLAVHSTDKIAPPPFPPSEVWTLEPANPLRGAFAEDGTDLTGVLARRDGLFAPPGVPLPPPLRGMTHPRVLTLDFGPLDPGAPLVLALTGWLQYGDASTNIALSQGDAWTVVPPDLEVETSAGRWLPVGVAVGMPAGKTKTILCDLTGRLPPGGRRLRLRTTFEIRWDRIALFSRRRSDQALRQVFLAPTRAELGWHGFSELAAPAPDHPTVPDHGRTSDRPPWRRALEGWCTRYGDVRELLAKRDGRLVLVNSGDVVRLAFDPRGLPRLEPGWRRTWFFLSVGWDKDGDHNVTNGDRVEPLPEAAASPEDGWQERYNTRWVSGDRFALD